VDSFVDRLKHATRTQQKRITGDLLRFGRGRSHGWPQLELTTAGGGNLAAPKARRVVIQRRMSGCSGIRVGMISRDVFPRTGDFDSSGGRLKKEKKKLASAGVAAGGRLRPACGRFNEVHRALLASVGPATQSSIRLFWQPALEGALIRGGKGNGQINEFGH